MKTSKVFLIGFIFFVFCWVLYLFAPFLLTISIGILMAVSTTGLNVKFLKLTKNYKKLSATLTTLTLCALFFVPFLYAIIEIAKSAMHFDTNHITTIINYIKNYDFALPYPLSGFESKIKEFIANFDIRSVTKDVINYLSAIGKSSANFATDMGLIIVFFFFANLCGSDFISYIKRILPVKEQELQSIFNEVASTMSVVFYSTISNAILQGFLFSIISGIYGYDGMLMGILFAFASLIPIVGGALIYAPVGIYELANGNTSAAIIIVVYSIIVISTIADNIIRPLIIKFINSKLVSTPANTNELAIFFAMIAGISTFGFWGMILGPAILTLFLALLKLYENLKNRNFID